jgi:hypothetical protein
MPDNMKAMAGEALMREISALLGENAAETLCTPAALGC